MCLKHLKGKRYIPANTRALNQWVRSPAERPLLQSVWVSKCSTPPRDTEVPVPGSREYLAPGPGLGGRILRSHAGDLRTGRATSGRVRVRTGRVRRVRQVRSAGAMRWVRVRDGWAASAFASEPHSHQGRMWLVLPRPFGGCASDLRSQNGI